MAPPRRHREKQTTSCWRWRCPVRATRSPGPAASWPDSPGRCRRWSPTRLRESFCARPPMSPRASGNCGRLCGWPGGSGQRSARQTYSAHWAWRSCTREPDGRRARRLRPCRHPVDRPAGRPGAAPARQRAVDSRPVCGGARRLPPGRDRPPAGARSDLDSTCTQRPRSREPRPRLSGRADADFAAAGRLLGENGQELEVDLHSDQSGVAAFCSG